MAKQTQIIVTTETTTSKYVSLSEEEVLFALCKHYGLDPNHTEINFDIRQGSFVDHVELIIRTREVTQRTE